MPWNEPGNNSNNNQQDPWGGKRNNNQNPPDLDKILSDFIKKLRAFFKPGSGGSQNNNSSSWQPASTKEYGYGIGLGVLIIFILWILSGLFIVNPAEQGVLLRFGQFDQVVQPGLHWMARFIDTKYLVDVQKIYAFSLEGNFLTKSSEQIDVTDITKKTPESADQSKNLVNVELNVQYRITDPKAYLFKVVNPDDTIQEVTAGALSDVVGQMKLDDVLTTGREMLSSSVLSRAKQILANYDSGLEIVTVTLRKVQAPDQVRAAFSDVNRADQDRATTIQQAQAYASKVVPLAQGVAARILADASGYRQQVVLGAQADIARYQAMLQAYQASPDITRERLYLTAMQNIMVNTSKVLIDANSSNNLLYLPLDKLMQDKIKVDSQPSVDNALSSAAMQQSVTTSQAAHDDASVNSNQVNGVGVRNDTN